MWTALTCDLHFCVAKQEVRFRSELLLDDEPDLRACLIFSVEGDQKNFSQSHTKYVTKLA